MSPRTSTGPARYLERAEDTARIVREHTNLMVDLPTSVAVTWEPLLAILGGRAEFDARYERADEPAIVRYLVADRAQSEQHPHERRAGPRGPPHLTREVLPREAWHALNDLYLYVASHHLDGVARREPVAASSSG